MAYVKVCPNCSFSSPARAFQCAAPGCGTTLGDIETVWRDAPPGSSQSSTANATPVSVPKPPAGDVLPTATCLHCGYERNRGADATCLRCGRPLAAGSKSVPIGATQRDERWCAVFAFGEFDIDPILRVGRDPAYSPLAELLMRFDKVSRRHAELVLKQGVLSVVDLNSTNGVSVNSALLPSGSSKALRPGDEVGFSSQVTVTLRQS